MAACGSIRRTRLPTRCARLSYFFYLTLLLLSAICSASPLAGAADETLPGPLLNQDLRVDLPQLHIRDDDQASETASIASTAASSTGTSTSSTSTDASPIFASSTASANAIPRPFDTSLGNNFTQASCPMFFESFLNNPTFQKCIPFSLLLQNSQAWFEISASNSTLTPILDDACAASFQTCSSLMTQLSGQLISSSNCAADYSLSNPLVVQAYRGLLSYSPMYKASCLKADPTGKSAGQNFPYCYASSLNSSSGADSMLYFLPLGLGLPGGTSISCSACNQQIMSIYAAAAADSNSPLNNEYLPAANMIDSACGTGFVNSSAAVTKSAASGKTNAAGRGAAPVGLLAIATSVLTAGSFLL